MRDGGRQGCYAGAWFSIRADSTRSETTDNTNAKNKKRSPGVGSNTRTAPITARLPNLPRDYVSGCKLKRCNQSLKIFHRSSAQMKSSDPACQVLILNLIETCPFHQERELCLVRKLLHRRR